MQHNDVTHTHTYICIIILWSACHNKSNNHLPLYKVTTRLSTIFHCIPTIILNLWLFSLWSHFLKSMFYKEGQVYQFSLPFSHSNVFIESYCGRLLIPGRRGIVMSEMDWLSTQEQIFSFSLPLTLCEGAGVPVHSDQKYCSSWACYLHNASVVTSWSSSGPAPLHMGQTLGTSYDLASLGFAWWISLIWWTYYR